MKNLEMRMASMRIISKRALTFFLCISILLSIFSGTMISATEYDNKAEFMAGNYGVMLHYLCKKNSNGTYEDWNKSVDSFDVDEFANTVNKIGASWVMLTLTQNDGKYCIPMPELEQLTGLSNLGTRRDLVNDLYTALSRYGIKIMLYWIPGAPNENEDMARLLGATERYGTDEYDDWKLNDTTVNNMSNIMRAVSNRYGTKIAGWWIDGCYDCVDFNSKYATQEAIALRSGNPNALVTFNNGTDYYDCRFEEESFTAGETCLAATLGTNDFTDYSADGQYSPNGYQRHFLTFLGNNWGDSGCYYETEKLVSHCYNNILSKNASITFDIGISNNGILSAIQVNQIAELNRYINKRMYLALDFEDLYNPFIWTKNVMNDNTVISSKDNILIASGAEALNGQYSFKVAVPELSSEKTEILSGTSEGIADIKFSGNKAFSKTDFTKCTGVMIRLKINDDSSVDSHRIKLNAVQEGLDKPTRLANGAFALDINGNRLEISSVSDYVTIPTNFDGFLFFPFASARSEYVTVQGKYDGYDDYPEHMVDFSKPFSLSIVLNDDSWNGNTVIMDDIGYYVGNDQDFICENLRNLGYKTVTFKTQPVTYSFPIDFENCQSPLSNVKYTAVKTEISTGKLSYPQVNSVINVCSADDQVLNGTYSYEIINGEFPDNSDEFQYAPNNIVSNYFNVKGMEELDTSKIRSNDYAYFKLRIKTSETSDGNNFKLRIGVRQNNVVYGYMGNGAKGYNKAGQLTTDIQSVSNYKAEGSAVIVSSGFDGTIYLPIYGMLTTGWKGVYSDNTTSKPDLTSDFQLDFEFFGNNLENTSFIIDDIDISFPSSGLPMNFDELVDSRIASVNSIYNNAEHHGDTNSVSITNEEQSLNKEGSLKICVPAANNNTRTETDYINVLGNTDYLHDDFTAVTGIWLRMKVVEEADYSGADHVFSLTSKQGEKVNIRFKDYVVLYDKTGKRIDYNSGSSAPQGFKVPAGFDGFVFMPFIGQFGFAGSYWGSYTNNPEKITDFSNDWQLSVFFADSTWNGSTVILDDISYYSSSANWTRIDEAADMDIDAWNTMRSAGYQIKYNAQPDSYSIPLDFENGEIPFESIKSYYIYTTEEGNVQYPTFIGNNDIRVDEYNNNASLYVKIPSNDNLTQNDSYRFVRAESNKAEFSGVKSLAKNRIIDAISNYAYLKIRIKLPATVDNSSYRISPCIQQDLNEYTTVLRGSFAYTESGNYLALMTDDLYTLIPSGFEGTVYFPIGRSLTHKNGQSGIRGTLDDSVDFSLNFNMYFNFNGTNWENTDLLLDDMSIQYNCLGDIDGDGIITASDLIYYRQYLLGVVGSLGDVADVNFDNYVNLLDLVKIKKSIAGINIIN